MTWVINWVVLTFSMWVASKLLKGFEIKGGLVSALLVSGLFGLLNVFLGGLLWVVIGISTLGLALLVSFITSLVVNAIVLKVTDAITDRLRVDGFGTAFVGALIMSLASTGAHYVLRQLH